MDVYNGIFDSVVYLFHVLPGRCRFHYTISSLYDIVFDHLKVFIVWSRLTASRTWSRQPIPSPRSQLRRVRMEHAAPSTRCPSCAPVSLDECARPLGHDIFAFRDPRSLLRSGHVAWQYVRVLLLLVLLFILQFSAASLCMVHWLINWTIIFHSTYHHSSDRSRR